MTRKGKRKKRRKERCAFHSEDITSERFPAYRGLKITGSAKPIKAAIRWDRTEKPNTKEKGIGDQIARTLPKTLPSVSLSKHFREGNRRRERKTPAICHIRNQNKPSTAPFPFSE